LPSIFDLILLIATVARKSRTIFEFANLQKLSLDRI